MCKCLNKHRGTVFGIVEPYYLNFIGNTKITDIFLYNSNKTTKYFHLTQMQRKNISANETLWGGTIREKKITYEEAKLIKKDYNKIRINVDYTDLNGIRKFEYILLNDIRSEEIIFDLYMNINL